MINNVSWAFKLVWSDPMKPVRSMYSLLWFWPNKSKHVASGYHYFALISDWFLTFDCIGFIADITNWSFLFLGASIPDAAKRGNLERIKELINVVPELKNKTDERGRNPLHIAAANGRLDCVKWLAVSGVDLAEETPTGYTAMHLAAMNGHVNCMMVSLKGKLYCFRNSSKLSPCL